MTKKGIIVLLGYFNAEIKLFKVNYAVLRTMAKPVGRQIKIRNSSFTQGDAVSAPSDENVRYIV